MLLVIRKFIAYCVAMVMTLSRIDVPREPLNRRAWYIYQLRLRGLTISEVARRAGSTQPRLSYALLAPSADAERILARAIGLAPSDLFPERFTEDGERRHDIRRRKAGTAS